MRRAEKELCGDLWLSKELLYLVTEAFMARQGAKTITDAGVNTAMARAIHILFKLQGRQVFSSISETLAYV